jgi:hypothetical protein
MSEEGKKKKNKIQDARCKMQDTRYITTKIKMVKIQDPEDEDGNGDGG